MRSVQVADSWTAAPEVGRMERGTVAQLIASAQATAQQAVASQRGRDKWTGADESEASSSSSSNSSGSSGNVDNAASTTTGDGRLGSFPSISAAVPAVGAAWAAVSSAPRTVAAMLRRLRRQQSVRHLEASLDHPDSGTQARPALRCFPLLYHTDLKSEPGQLCHSIWQPFKACVQ